MVLLLCRAQQSCCRSLVFYYSDTGGHQLWFVVVSSGDLSVRERLDCPVDCWSVIMHLWKLPEKSSFRMMTTLENSYEAVPQNLSFYSRGFGSIRSIFLADWSKGNLTQNSRIQSKPGIPEVVLYTFNFYVATHWGKRQLFIQKLPLVWCLKMWILWKMRLCKCEFCEKWDFENVNFAKHEIL